ncbi:MAG: exopolysaccharide biosynthesis protein [Pseudomonadota bacterium]
MADRDEDLVDVIAAIKEKTEGDTVTVADVVHALGRRAFGSLLVITALLAVLPTGAIPGASILFGAIMLLLSVQLLIGADKVWLPKAILSRGVGRERVVASLDRAKSIAGRIDRLIGPRLTILVRPPFVQLVALVGVIVSLSMVPLALVPFGAFPAGLSLLVIGLGLMVRDGLLIALGIAVGAIGLALTIAFWPF